jgi:sodium-dependent dicarboxylate transporter 2/3/5
MAPIGWLMTFLLWGFFMVVMKPEKKTIPGLREKAKRLSEEMGGITKKEIIAAVIVGTAILVLGLSAV